MIRSEFVACLERYNSYKRLMHKRVIYLINIYYLEKFFRKYNLSLKSGLKLMSKEFSIRQFDEDVIEVVYE